MTRRDFLIGTFCLLAVVAYGQRPRYDKLSPMVRQLVRQAGSRRAMPAVGGQVCALVKTTDPSVLSQYGCRVWDSVGDICVATIPVGSLAGLSLDDSVVRIEANRGMQTLTDSMAFHLDALPAYEGRNLPQAYTGRGVVVGLMDIGFDLTHPNFYSRDLSQYRIGRLWDMLSVDTVGSSLPVGRDYAGAEALLSLGHSRDGLGQTHGTHTLGIAAGSGYDSPYRGMAPEAGICLVANATSNNAELIDSADYYKYTFATDALGFKYLFDYADSLGLPCVASFSEGSGQDFRGYDVLFYEMLERLSGPGHIIVASAGNQGRQKTWFRKASGTASEGTFLRSYDPSMMVTMKSAGDFQIRLVAYTGLGDTLICSTGDVLRQPDSLLAVTMLQDDSRLDISIEAYPSCYDARETCYDLTITGKEVVGRSPRLSLEVLGADADVEVYRCSGVFTSYAENPALSAGECSHNVLSPSTAPGVISVGGTIYREGITNYLGQWLTSEAGSGGQRGTYSSAGPTMDGRVKPDVMAPGANIISSYSSYYIEQHPAPEDRQWDVVHFSFRGRTYAWSATGGTSMSAPAVAGAIALWLQAKPDLTPGQVLEVLSRTARRLDATSTVPNNLWGYGEINVYRGLLDILGFDRIAEVSVHQSPVRFTVSGRRLYVGLPEVAESPLRLRLFGLDCSKVADVMLPAGQTNASVALPPLASGVYAVQVSGSAALQGSSLVRIGQSAP